MFWGTSGAADRGGPCSHEAKVSNNHKCTNQVSDQEKQHCGKFTECDKEGDIIETKVARGTFLRSKSGTPL